MIKNGVPHCDYCNKELVALRDQECLDDIDSHGWTDWRSASVHSCYECYDNMWIPPCHECHTQPCVKGECWASPPLHLFPYETYFANKLGEETYAWKEDDEEPREDVTENEQERIKEDLEIRRRQLMKLAGQHPKQKLLKV